MSGPLNGLRIVATLPPHPWFGGIDYNFAIEMTEELRRMGATVFDLHVGGFIARNDIYIREAIEALKSFRPDVAISLPNALYILLCVTPKHENIFRDILQIPTLMLWDHGLLQLPYQILGPLPSTPAESRGGSIRRLKKVLDHPLYVHYSPDSCTSWAWSTGVKSTSSSSPRIPISCATDIARRRPMHSARAWPSRAIST
jgi:hypothetical protein